MTRFELILGIVAFTLILSAVFGIVYTFESTRCASIGSSMQVDSRYGILTDCMVNINGKWVPLANYRVL